MFKKVILLIIFAAMAGVFLLVSAMSDSNNKRCSNGGKFENDFYLNDHSGIEVDLRGNWVYCDTDGMKKLANSSSGTSFDVSDVDFDSDDGKYVMFALRPGTVISFLELDFELDRDFLNVESMYYMYEASAESLRESGYSCSEVDHGLLDSTDGIYYYQIKYNGRGESGNVVYAFFNSGTVGYMVMGYSSNEGKITDIKNFIIDNVKIKHNDTGVSV